MLDLVILAYSDRVEVLQLECIHFNSKIHQPFEFILVYITVVVMLSKNLSCNDTK